MPMPEEKLEQIASKKLEEILTRSNEQLLSLLDQGLELHEDHDSVRVHFDVLMYEDRPKQYRVVVYAWDDGPAREEFPVMASTDLIFED